jgi:hypothetical protein
MAFKVSVPATSDRHAAVVMSNVTSESAAITLAENLLGYVILDLPYVLTDIQEAELSWLGIAPGSAALINAGGNHGNCQ